MNGQVACVQEDKITYIEFDMLVMAIILGFLLLLRFLYGFLRLLHQVVDVLGKLCGCWVHFSRRIANSDVNG